MIGRVLNLFGRSRKKSVEEVKFQPQIESAFQIGKQRYISTLLKLDGAPFPIPDDAETLFFIYAANFPELERLDLESAPLVMAECTYAERQIIQHYWVSLFLEGEELEGYLSRNPKNREHILELRNLGMDELRKGARNRADQADKEGNKKEERIHTSDQLEAWVDATAMYKFTKGADLSAFLKEQTPSIWHVAVSEALIDGWIEKEQYFWIARQPECERMTGVLLYLIFVSSNVLDFPKEQITTLLQLRDRLAANALPDAELGLANGSRPNFVALIERYEALSPDTGLKVLSPTDLEAVRSREKDKKDLIYLMDAIMPSYNFKEWADQEITNRLL